MPRLPPSLVRRARHVAPELATLLPACRTLLSARNELRWLREHVEATTITTTATTATTAAAAAAAAAVVEGRRRNLLARLCHQRGRGVPLQYILGTQPFGHLDIRCRPGVLIPRPETEAYTCHLIDLLRSGELLSRPPAERPSSLGIIDFCTGTGCIPLLAFESLKSEVESLNVRGVDISPIALDLADANATYASSRHPRAEKQLLRFSRTDVFSDADIRALARERWDVMISNPPYVSRDVWNHGRGQLGPSVRKFEPLLALVPGQQLPLPPPGLRPEDIFYSRLLDVASILKPEVILLEVGDQDQARRVAGHCLEHAFCADATVELWRDGPDLTPSEDEQVYWNIRTARHGERVVPVKGSGNVRSVLIRREV
ncbi:Type I restriction-modification system, DNA methylase subunit [Geosmithia morbida]|uniref:Type I restriction-modification system, DNA methylase subunit n=1 Tax=Geosmithia morbida TaxID=1094350 RepID=A0A9P4YT26_9HYPO|nr:Type I restriction-modification system, DNA methylase subunit [Geosmithia morbida]KAF4120494.1 Type I restriction-modification system, DNA methylase subunit [Geosmithia morbida]